MVTMTKHFRIQTATTQGRRNQGQGGHLPFQFLAAQLNLSEPGDQIMPSTVLFAPLDFLKFDGYNDNTLSDTDSINSDVSSGISISDLNARTGRHSGEFDICF